MRRAPAILKNLRRTKMAKIYLDKDADLSLIQSKKVAIIGYGSQGHAHAQNLRDNGVSVRIGLPAQSASRTRAQADGFTVSTPSEATAWADVVMILTPDTKQPALYKQHIEPHLTAGKMLMFAHGFNIRYGTINPSANVDVSMVAPKSPGHRVCELFVDGIGTPALFGNHQEARNNARALNLLYYKVRGAP